VRSGQATYYRDLIWVLVSKELKLRYHSTAFGYLWSVLSPLAFATIFFVVFKIVMRIKIEHYALFLITGLFPWQWFSNSATASNYFFLDNRSLIKKIRFPRHFLVMAGVLNDMIHFVISIPVIVAFMLHYHIYPSTTWIFLLPLLVIVQFLFTTGIALTLASCNLFFRDLERMTLIGVTFWFYLTPVIYSVAMIPEHYRWVVLYGKYANPMAPIIICWREMFLNGTAPLTMVAAACGWAALAFGVGWWIYRSLQWRFAEIV
jgi:lipopolysaccharide transport system permease protein